MEMGMVLPIAPMRMEHHNIAPSERLAPDGAIESIQALRPTAHEGAQHVSSVLVEGRAEHRWHRQDDMPINHPRVEDPADLAAPVVDGDFDTPQAQGRFTAHRHEVFALATLQAAVFDVPHFLWVAATKAISQKEYP
jgi:hypothetical protein